jgi:diaminohydroxyphosphoribosylaminopyrimidine deaminase / 5-amino-6-(5-phosphoribosylamino)uracil reductase
LTDIEYMRLALTLAKSVVGQTRPNPPVGAVVVKDNRIVGMGAHLKAGEAHAEVHALNMAGDLAEGATVYVTLEPCSHHGKTPPCASLLIHKKVKRVVVSTLDPNPLVSGQGIQKLEHSGVDVSVGLLQEESNELYQGFFHYISTKTPFVTLKTAITLDGKTAAFSGDSKWITGEIARKDVHTYRHKHDAILVGINTVLKDNPSLTTRLSNGGLHPIRIVLDTNLRIPLESTMINDGLSDVWIITGPSVSEDKKKQVLDKNVKIIELEEKINIKSLLKRLGEENITSLLVEGGAEVNASFLKEQAFNQVIAYVAPKLIGGRNSPGFIGGNGFELMSNAYQLEFKSVEKMGDDIKIIAVPQIKGV